LLGRTVAMIAARCNAQYRTLRVGECLRCLMAHAGGGAAILLRQFP